ncbi:hypothetical protein MKW98_016610 [Papaver atlanticum]|uniref:protein-serine/threonine phosphatase n=1 Tax=Papaver atlanticum TaxID=357466 RepID=A0AAD4STA9_9MAGN|nr:hypothetical protein MKW98_016610 [Papaver atlanticum]
MTTTYEKKDRLKDLSYEDLLKEAERVLKRRKIYEFSCNQNINIWLIAFSKIFGNTYKRCFFEKKKLCLVLDLDHTLLHSVRICDVSKDDQDYLNKKAIVVSSEKDIKGLGSSGDNFDRFELFVYTLGNREYARNMGRLFDPEGVFFNSIESRDDSTVEDRKNLDILAGPDEKNTIIIDDNKYVWKEHKNNLIEIHSYNYFTDSNEGHILKKGEEDAGFDEKDEALKSISEVLQRVHEKFFELFPVPQTDVHLKEYIKSVDVRPIFKAYREKESGRKVEESKQVLLDTISCVDLSQFPPDNIVEDLREEENRVQVVDETCDQEPSKESQFETDIEDKISPDEGIAIGKVKFLETIVSRFSMTCVQIMDKLLKATALLEVSNGGTAVDMRAFAVAYRHS